jgi:hypothetical protein
MVNSVDFTTGFRLESHVEKAFLTAFALAGGPINARHALMAALIVNHTANSPAFKQLASLLPVTPTETPSRVRSKAGLTAIPLDGPLLDAYSAAEQTLREGDQSVWGRDYVTLVLLPGKDPSLHEVAREAGKTVEDLQDEWFHFVTADPSHRSKESWINWWRRAAVPLPDERRRVPPADEDTLVLAWRLVVDFKAEPALLRHMDPGLLQAALEKWESESNANKEFTLPARRAGALRQLESHQTGRAPNELWLAWMRATVASRVGP